MYVPYWNIKMVTSITGREYEIQQLQRVFDSKEAEFVAIYGRRRIGKTFLVRKFFEKKSCIFFQVTGIHNAVLRTQLKEFRKEIERTFYASSKSTKLQTPTNWLNALELLTDTIKIFSTNSKKVVLFFDEFPWMATRKSGLLQAIDYYWNRFWVNENNIKLIICGSAASWIIDNVLNNKAGLYNRVTCKICLEPFTLRETKYYLKQRGVNLNNQQVLQLYICIGGIPYYLKFIEKGLSAVQNINKLCFQKKGTLLDEFTDLFSSLFNCSEIHAAVIKLIASKRNGISRTEIERSIKYKGGRLSKRLRELEEAGFIISFIPWERERGTYYKIIDEYTLFYLTWINPSSKNRILEEVDNKYWEDVSQTSAWKAWSGYAFETVCYKHLSNIRKALEIPSGACASTWRYREPRNSDDIGAQIDLLFDRPDEIINICEIKYSTAPYKLDKVIARNLLNKVNVYRKITKTKKQIFISMITSSYLKPTMHSEEIISSEVTLDELFK